jgi:hypothetical protein
MIAAGRGTYSTYQLLASLAVFNALAAMYWFAVAQVYYVTYY